MCTLTFKPKRSSKVPNTIREDVVCVHTVGGWWVGTTKFIIYIRQWSYAYVAPVSQLDHK